MGTRLQSAESTRLEKLAAFVDDYWPQLLRDTCAAVVVVVGVWAGLDKSEQAIDVWLASPATLVLVALAMVGGVGAVQAWKREPGASELKNKNSDLEEKLVRCHGDHNALLARELAFLSFQLSFKHSERISVYKHDGKAFVMLGRFSSNPAYNQRGRGAHSDREGCIRDVWERGRACRTNLPNPAKDLDAYAEELHKLWNLDRALSRGFVLKCRSIGGLRIDEPGTGKPMAVMMFESTKATCINAAILEKAEQVDGGRIGRFLERMQAIEPTPTLAASKGF